MIFLLPLTPSETRLFPLNLQHFPLIIIVIYKIYYIYIQISKYKLLSPLSVAFMHMFLHSSHVFPLTLSLIEDLLGKVLNRWHTE